MAMKFKRLTLHLRTFLMIIWAASGSAGYNCPYGQNCVFEPSPPGRAPACAQPGLTYCLHPDPYPEKVIRKLVEAGQYDIRTLLSDESRDDFDSKKKGGYPYGYGPNSLPHVDQISLVDDGQFNKDYNKFYGKFNHDVYSDKTPLQPPSPSDPAPYNVKAYQSSNFTKFGFQGYHTSPTTFWNPAINQYEYDNRRLRQNNGVPNIDIYNPNYFNSPLYQNYESEWLRQTSSGVTQYNPNEWWKYISPSRSDADVTIQRSVTFPTHTSTLHKRRRRNAALVEEAAKRTLTGAEALRIALGLAKRISRAAPSAGVHQHGGAVPGAHAVHHAARSTQQQRQLAVRRQHAGRHDAAGASRDLRVNGMQ
ncbi:uncharacterized protein LOC112045091 isoform X2 [Bicyclus anynana]|uniref:Uncharacterized protein LOC112045091 isoform X2 n=1 Tax=Bicyclus anynana TaxID=110368 RepID=A0A6J1N228_BICAN|nr:uncharacterized protein LOC112045091 isoform X2 [Bicyclus anynana]